MNYPTVHVLTGPPGSGKTTYAKTRFPTLPVYDHDLRNKEGWRTAKGDCVLMTSAPSRSNKEYWSQEVFNEGKQPDLLVMWVPRMVAWQRMRQRSGLTPYERNDLEKSVERWYKLYSPSPQETRVG